MSDHHDGRDHEYCEQCGDCVLCDVPHVCHFDDGGMMDTTHIVDSYTHIHISAPTWDALPDAITALQEAVATNGAVPCPSFDKLKSVPKKNWLVVRIGESNVLEIPMVFKEN